MRASSNKPSDSRLLRALLFGAGVLATLLGVLGIFLPLLPTVPLLLLAVACFARSTPRCHAWLLDHPRLGPLVAGYLDGDGIPLRAKVVAIGMIWLSASLSLHLAAPPPSGSTSSCSASPAASPSTCCACQPGYSHAKNAPA